MFLLQLLECPKKTVSARAFSKKTHRCVDPTTTTSSRHLHLANTHKQPQLSTAQDNTAQDQNLTCLGGSWRQPAVLR